MFPLYLLLRRDLLRLRGRCLLGLRLLLSLLLSLLLHLLHMLHLRLVCLLLRRSLFGIGSPAPIIPWAVASTVTVAG